MEKKKLNFVPRLQKFIVGIIILTLGISFWVSGVDAGQNCYGIEFISGFITIITGVMTVLGSVLNRNLVKELYLSFKK